MRCVHTEYFAGAYAAAARTGDLATKGRGAGRSNLARGNTSGSLVAFLTLQDTINTGNRQQEVANKQQDLAEQGQITERFTRAVEQLGQEGDDTLAIRLGGIYALERIMRDARIDGPNAVDQRNVVELLCAFIRMHARQPGPLSPESQTPEPVPDVQAALTVLGRRANSDQPGFGTDPKFGIVDLRHAHLEGARLEGSQLQGARLEGAHLDRAHLEGANLTGAHLGAVLNRKYANGAVLYGAFLSGANLTNAHLEDSYIGHDTHMDATNLTGASLAGAHLGSGDVKKGADLSSTIGLTTENLKCVFIEGSKQFPTKFPTGMNAPADRTFCPSVE